MLCPKVTGTTLYLQPQVRSLLPEALKGLISPVTSQHWGPVELLRGIHLGAEGNLLFPTVEEGRGEKTKGRRGKRGRK